MTTIHDLRATLARHADDVDDSERYARPVAVRGRIERARRRRQTTAAGVAAVVLLAAASATGALLRGGSRPEPASPVDVHVPTTVRFEGTTYRLDGVRTVRPGSDLPISSVEDLRTGRSRLVSLVVTGLDDGSATLSVNGAPATRVLAGEQRSAAVGAEAGQLTSARVDLAEAPARTRVGIAVYEAVAADLFPADRGDQVLVDASTAPAGTTSTQLTVDDATSDLVIETYCVAPGRRVSTTIDGRTAGVDDCGSSAVDARSTQSGDLPAARFTIAARLVRGARDEAPGADVGGAALGVAVYRWTSRRDVLGTPVSETVDHGGRRWRLADVVEPDAMGAVRRSIPTGDEDVLLGYVTRGGTAVWWQDRAGVRRHVEFPGGSPSAWTAYAGVLPAGDRYEVTASPVGGPAQTALLVYRPG